MTTKDTVERKERTTKPKVKSDKRKVTRKNRVPYVANESTLSVPASIREQYEPDNRYRWVNDEEGEVQRREQAGWEKVHGVGLGSSISNQPEQMGDLVMRPVGVGKGVAALNAILMTIPYEFYKEDFDTQQKQNMAFHNSLKKGSDQVEGAGSTVGGSYAPNLPDGGKGFSESQSDHMIKD